MNESVLGYPLNEDEKVLLQLKPSPKIVWTWMFSKVAHLIFLGAILEFLFISHLADHPSTYQNLIPLPLQYLNFLATLIVVISVCLASYGCYLWLLKAAKSHDYVITNQRCFLRCGLLSLNIRIIPIAQINDVNIQSDLPSQYCQLENVFIDTISTAYANAMSSAYGNINRNLNKLNNSTVMEGLTKEQSQSAVSILSQLMVKTKN